MVRAPFQVLVFPYRFTQNNPIEYAIFFRAGDEFWQGVSGGGEDDETHLEAARSEANEETGLPVDLDFFQLDTTSSIPAFYFTRAATLLWENDFLVVPEYSFGVNAESHPIILSHEHETFRWVDYQTAWDLLKWDSNKTALWELNTRLKS